MTIRWMSFLACAPFACVLAMSCSSSESTGGGGCSGASCAGSGGAAGKGGGGTGGTTANIGGAGGRAVGVAGQAGESMGGESSGGAAGSLGVGGAAGSDNGGAAGESGGPAVVIPPLMPSAIPDLALWLDGNADAYSDIDENNVTTAPYGRVRSVPEASPLTGSWQAFTTSLQRPVREAGAFGLRPVVDPYGYGLKDTAGTIQTDNSTLAIAFRSLVGDGGSANGAIVAPVGASSQQQGIYFVGAGVGLYLNHTQYALKKLISRASAAVIIVRFTPQGATVDYDINGLRSSETVAAPVTSETAAHFMLGYDSHNNGGMYGYVSQVVGVNRAVSDDEKTGLMNWLEQQPLPDAFPVTKPLVSVMGDSIANGDQVANFDSWAFKMLGDLNDINPDIQMLNAATNGAGIPKVRGSDYSDYVLPYFSAARKTNILILAAGTNDLANANDLNDMLTRYYSLLDSARATGYKVVACTILPRSNAGMVAGLAGFETTRAAFNADIVKNWAMHADALADVAAIPGMGAAGDSDNTKYYSADKIHPITAGHALLEPVYLAAVKGLL